jgi:hypothetical protein
MTPVPARARLHDLQKRLDSRIATTRVPRRPAHSMRGVRIAFCGNEFAVGKLNGNQKEERLDHGCRRRHAPSPDEVVKVVKVVEILEVHHRSTRCHLEEGRACCTETHHCPATLAA